MLLNELFIMKLDIFGYASIEIFFCTAIVKQSSLYLFRLIQDRLLEELYFGKCFSWCIYWALQSGAIESTS